MEHSISGRHQNNEKNRYVRHCFRCWGYINEQNKGPALLELHSSEETMTNENNNNKVK